MSGRLSKWILLVFVPLLLALYASYPPVGVPVSRQRIEKKVARTDGDAAAHNVRKGQQYLVEHGPERIAWLPLALGKTDEVTQVVERLDDGTIVEEKTTYIEGRIKLGLDVAGGTELLYMLRQKEGEEGISGKIGETIDILKRRIDPSNVKEYRIQQVGQDRILIQVPQATTAEVEQLKDRLERMGKLEFKLAAPRGGDQAKFVQLYQQADAGIVPEGYVKMFVDDDPAKVDREGRPSYFLVKEGDAEITGQYLAPGSLRSTFDSTQRPAVGFEFNAMGKGKFATITEKNMGWSLAIILDGVLKSAPIIESRIYGSGIIRGDFTQEEVRNMINVLQAGSLPMDIALMQESTVGPQLGRDSIQRGLRALFVAGLLVLGFIGIYYMRCGLVADAALILNVILLVGVLAILGAALTLPGMAGILLTVGMAVDANVLIFERIREESAAGKGIRVALRNGYERAFTTIVDANVTTLLTAVILYLIGTGPVRGFAVTLSFGIMLSMFTALAVTRLAFETMIDREWLTEFRMRQFFKQPSIGFSAIRRPAYIASAIVVAVGLAVFVSRGSRLYDIDFTGGSLIQVSLARPTPVSDVRSRLAAAGLADAEVQGVRTAEAAHGDPTDFAIRIKGAAVDLGSLAGGVQGKLGAAGLPVAEGGVKPAADGSGLVVSFTASVLELDLRKALGRDGDPYDLPDITAVVPADDPPASPVTLRLADGFGLDSPRQVRTRMVRTLSWAGLRAADYAIEESRTVDGAAGDPPHMALVLGGQVHQEVLNVALSRLQFPDLDAKAADDIGTAFTVTGPKERLEQFAREFPAGAQLQGVPDVTIDGSSLTARLAEGRTEQDLRSLFEQQGFGPLLIVAPGLGSTGFRLTVSYESVRQKMLDIFGDLAGGSMGVTFAPAEEAAAEEGAEGSPEAETASGVAAGAAAGATAPAAAREKAEGPVEVVMTLGEPMPFADVRHYIGTAGIGSYGEDIIVGQEDYSADSLVTEVRLSLPADKADAIEQAIAKVFDEPQPVQKVVDIGPTVAQEMQGRALLAVVFASVIIVLYVAMRFHAFRFGVAAVIALIHDILITAGLIAVADLAGVFGDVKVNLAMLAAFLTILGYSLNDTIVVFDRIRENMAKMGRKVVSAELIDASINQTLSRTVLTSLTTFMVVFVLYLMGGSVLQGLALTLMIGVVVGTYSSMFIASPILLDWVALMAGVRTAFRVVLFPIKLPFRLLGMLLSRGRDTN